MLNSETDSYSLRKEDCCYYLFDICCQLIQSGAKIEALNGNSSFHLATRYINDSKSKLLSLMLEKVPEFLDALDEEGYTPLYWAVKTGKLTFTEILIPYFKDKRDACEPLLFSALLIFFKKEIWGSWNFYGPNNTMYSFIDGYRAECLENLYLPLLEKVSSFLLRNDEKNYQQLWLTEIDPQGNTFLHILARDAPYILTEIIKRQYIDPALLQLKNKENLTIQYFQDKAQQTFDLVKACFHVNIEEVKNLINQHIDL